jgi:hypothetical protein
MTNWNNQSTKTNGDWASRIRSKDVLFKFIKTDLSNFAAFY